MGLYLCVFANDTDDDEVAAVEVGTYEEFGEFREAVCRRAEAGRWGSRYPTLMNHPDSDGEWTPAEALLLTEELRDLLARRHSMLTGYTDADGLPLIEGLLAVAEAAVESDRPISFQ